MITLKIGQKKLTTNNFGMTTTNEQLEREEIAGPTAQRHCNGMKPYYF